MHPNEQLLTRFYEAFARKDAAAMASAYAPTATFSDPVFPSLEGPAIADMWTMLTERARDFSLTFSGVSADDVRGAARWEARYLFGGSRPVHNVIDATFTFEGGKIVRHVDRFDFHRWSGQALGPVGLLLGWTGFLKARVQAQSAATLAAWKAKRGR